MKKIYTILIAALSFSSSAYAQSPAQNLMPDGSHDMYLGFGVISRPIYEGAAHNKRVVIPVMQIQWSNGVFLSGMNAGWHLSNQFNHEFGPLISLEPNRTSSGTSNSIHTPSNISSGIVGPLGGDSFDFRIDNRSKNKLVGLDEIRTRLLYGGFYNLQISSNLRQTNTILFGAGNQQDGIRLSSDLRYRFKDVLPHHQFTVGLGVTFMNQAYAQTYFGVTELESSRSINEVYTPSAGLKNIHADFFWNWNLNSSWLVTTKMNISQFANSSKKSPLVERNNNVTVSTAIAYRF